MLTPNLHGAIGGIVANPGVLLALGAALTLIWLGAALLSALRRKVKPGHAPDPDPSGPG